MSTRVELLAKFLDVLPDEITEEKEENLFSIGRQEYYVLTVDEATKKAEEYIEQSLWAFNMDFLIHYLPVPNTEKVIKCFQKIQEELCEDCNDLFAALVFKDRPLPYMHFMSDVIGTDGRGHFISSYDGKEEEIYDEEEGVFYFIYRIN